MTVVMVYIYFDSLTLIKINLSNTAIPLRSTSSSYISINSVG
jgi:hypothetical protein